jgi:hypothetical protein
LFRRPGRKNDDSGVVQSRRVISRGHLDSPGGLLLLPVDISVAGREKDKNGMGGQRNAKKSDFFQVKLNRERRLKIRLKKTKDPRSRLLSSWVVNHTVNHQVKASG